MILERLTLWNFCLYRGEQTFNLAPQRRNGKRAPIILFGGINGGGKTTVLDAIQLALYGSRALCSKRGSLGYEQFLRECIHHGVEAREGASLALRFRFAAEGEEHLYEVCRAWSLRGQKVAEELYVARDGVRDRWLSDNWNQMVEELVPLGISQLFFFDAEKIRFLAEDESCSAVLGSAIKSLLGLNLAERLIADAAAMESRFTRQIRADVLALETQRQKLVGKRTEAAIGSDEAARMANLAARTRETMKEYLRQATTAKIHRLSTLITESFRFLLRKKTLVQQIHIDPETFSVRIFDDAGHAIPKRRLSEGEKQIFAISVLWGLARASARSLPAIIDTPMARLDVKHRNHLVQRYFPNASHQVVILSTDTEVDRRYYDELAPHISRAYHLNYDEEKKVTVGEEGYFWTREEQS